MQITRYFICMIAGIVIACSPAASDKTISPNDQDSTKISLLAEGINKCLDNEKSRELLKSENKFSMDDPKLPDLVERFVTTPNRFDPEKLLIYKLEKGSAELWIASSVGYNDCEAMLTKAPDHLEELQLYFDKFDELEPKQSIDEPQFQSFFWVTSNIHTSANNNKGLVNFEGTGPETTNNDEIQLTFSVMKIAE